MDYQPKPQFEELALRGECTVDCSSCPTFPAPFRRTGEPLSCRFNKLEFNKGKGVAFPKPAEEGAARLLFVMSGSLTLSLPEGHSCHVESGQCLCLADEGTIEACDDGASVVVMSLCRRMEFCESDLFDGKTPEEVTVRRDATPVVSMHSAVVQLLESLFAVPELYRCLRYHSHKGIELFMLLRTLYTPAEFIYLFQTMVHPRDNFRVFVINNYDKARGVGELAALAGMSLSVFKRRFAEHFNDSVYHWMMQQKAQKIHNDIRNGADSTKALMAKYEFRHYTQFSRFCKNYLQATPAQLIASTKSRKR